MHIWFWTPYVEPTICAIERCVRESHENSQVALEEDRRHILSIAFLSHDAIGQRFFASSAAHRQATSFNRAHDDSITAAVNTWLIQAAENWPRHQSMASYQLQRASSRTWWEEVAGRRSRVGSRLTVGSHCDRCAALSSISTTHGNKQHHPSQRQVSTSSFTCQKHHYTDGCTTVCLLARSYYQSTLPRPIHRNVAAPTACFTTVAASSTFHDTANDTIRSHY